MPNMTTTTIRVALDWTPNTNHSGLYLAREKGLYSDRGLDVQFLVPDDDYSVTPAKRVQQGEADLAVCPSESCIAYNETGRMRLQAIYAILQKDASAIASTRLTDIKGLEGGVYGSYNAKYEDHIVRAMIDAGGGKGENMKIQSSTGKLSLFDEVRKGNADATWIFLPWEGVEVEMDGSPLHAFRPEDYGVPYGFSPVIARNMDSSVSTDALRNFVQATAKGYEYALRDAKEAVAVLAPHCRPGRSERFLSVSQERINGFYGDDDGNARSLGYMKPAKWDEWMAWLEGRGLLRSTDVDVAHLFTNEFFA